MSDRFDKDDAKVLVSLAHSWSAALAVRAAMVAPVSPGAASFIVALASVVGSIGDAALDAISEQEAADAGD